MAQSKKYMIVKEEIKESIIKGDVKPGEKIQSENELIKRFEVSRHTIRKAIGDLIHEGWLYSEQGAGTFCSNQIHEDPNSHSKSSGKSIGVITTYISDYIFPSIIKGIESYLTNHGFSLILACTDNDLEKEKQCLEMMLNRNIDGLIIEPTKSSSFNPNINYYLQLEQNQIPYLMINQFYSQLNPPHLILDDEKGGFLATEHLIKQGHVNIVGFFKTDDLQGINRMKGFIRAFRENNISLFPEMIITYTTEDDNEELLNKMKNRLIPTDTAPTGIICYNDTLALKILDLLRTLGIKIPEDISIVGYDDSYLAEASEIKLTSITHPKTQMGLDAAKWIVSAVENKNSPKLRQDSIIYNPVLIERSSTGIAKSNSENKQYKID
ncbi:GntR family transcriptional regulator [Cytobacillus gottheilii]|uniref:GntR family transcriptional regulator n=1 Tax=Cytobacillus gottheilii TaxID=859144 RepID=A0ABX8FHK0_9BACI|nr:GntR family transcriptional regulator [Cytobacillus gottheilii]QVY63515.1 GntR family transcriptional regulator [Cytobacillus gottheilii]